MYLICIVIPYSTTRVKTAFMISTFLSSPLASTLLATHPNDPIPSALAPSHPFAPWWDWSSAAPDQWTKLVRYHDHDHPPDRVLSSVDAPAAAAPGDTPAIPASLTSLIDHIRSETLPRSVHPPTRPPPSGGSGAHAAAGPRRPSACYGGMSEKKTHEVDAMAACVAALCQRTRRVVDVGAGQVRTPLPPL
jgi:hypothetical protein